MPRFSRLAALLLLATTAAHAQVTRVVDNNVGAPTGPRVYATFAAAEAASADGDTVQVTPSPTNYGAITITRRLTVRGGNLRVRPEQNGVVARFDGVTLAHSSDPQNPRNPSGTSLEGLHFNDLSRTGPGSSPNVRVNNCVFNTVNSGFPNGSVTNSSFISAELSNTSPGFIVRGNTISGPVTNRNSSAFVTVDHNLFYADNGRVSLAGSYIIVSNNIFFKPVANTAQNGDLTTFSTFTNNLSFGTSGTELPVAGATNTGSGNLVNVNPQFISFPTATSPATLFTTDFRLQPGSPAINAGSDGTNIGPTGGSAPFTSFFTGSPPQPVVTRLDVSPVVFVGSPVRVQVTAVGAIAAPAPRPSGAPAEEPLPGEPFPSEPAAVPPASSRDTDGR